jgi:hypothetical protein
MTYSTEMYRDDATDFVGIYTRDRGFDGVQESPADWAVGSDEAGTPIYSQGTFSDFLQRDLS